MPQTKLQLLDEARKLGLKVEPNTKMADLRQLIKEATDKKPKDTTKAKAVTPESEPEKTDAPAKAGKRSAKAIKEAEEQVAKKVRTNEVKPKVTQKPPKSKLERRSKGYKAVHENLEDGKIYGLDEAINLAKTTSPVKFNASVELHVNLNVDPRQAEQNIRDNVTLPAGSGKVLRIAALSEDPKEALSAGADIAGDDDLIQQIEKGNLDFDVLIAPPNLMPKLGKYAKILGPKGLMPNPKSGTVTNDIKKAISEAKAGRVEYRVDSNGIVHLAIGKTSFEASSLKDNVIAVMTSIRANKPSSIKSSYIKSVYLATAMGPSIAVDLVSINETT